MIGLVLAAVLSAQPNIVFVLIDDLGWRQLGSYGGLPTPHLDQLALNGMRFTAHYSSTVCSTSRAALLTGRYSARSGISDVVGINSEKGIPENEITLADTLHAAGYETAIVGKWGLGIFAWERPTQNGFEHAHWLPTSHNGLTLSWWEQDAKLEEVTSPAKLTPAMSAFRNKLTRRETQAALDFLATRDRRRPCFLYVAYSAIHIPAIYAQRLPRESADQATLRELDEGIGAIAAALPENTLLIVTSDNGGTGHNGPLRGAKSTCWEGGIRTPAIVRGPGISRAVVDEPVALWDWFTTLTLFGGGAIPGDRQIDGLDLRAVLHGTGHRAASEFWWPSAFRSGAWSLAYGHLYNLSQDIGQTTILDAQYPQLKADLAARAAAAKPKRGL